MVATNIDELIAELTEDERHAVVLKLLPSFLKRYNTPRVVNDENGRRLGEYIPKEAVSLEELTRTPSEEMLRWRGTQVVKSREEWMKIRAARIKAAENAQSS